MYFYIALSLKLNIVKGRGYETFKPKNDKKEHEDEAETVEEATTEEEQDATVTLVTHVNNILHSIFTKVGVYINN